jgi:hypothetical protein
MCALATKHMYILLLCSSHVHQCTTSTNVHALESLLPKCHEVLTVLAHSGTNARAPLQDYYDFETSSQFPCNSHMVSACPCKELKHTSAQTPLESKHTSNTRTNIGWTSPFPGPLSPPQHVLQILLVRICMGRYLR